MDVVPAQIADWTGWTFAGVTGIATIFAFIRGWIVPKSVLEMYKDVAKKAQEANEENSAALKELLEMGGVTVDLLKSLKTAEKGRGR